MRKKIFIALSALSLSLLGAFLVGCDKENTEVPEGPVESVQGVLDGTQESFDEKTYTYSFVTNGGSDVKGGSLYKNEFVAKPQDPVRYGYKFTGWYFDEDCTKLAEFVNYKMPARDMTFYAGWSKYSLISFDTNGGEEMDPIMGDAGDPVRNVPDPVWEGHIFEGWFADPDCTAEYVFTTLPSSDITVYAKWHVCRENVTVTFYANGEQVSTGAHTEGDVITLGVSDPAGDEAQYLEFAGWSVDTENNRVVTGTYVVTAEDTVLTAAYQTKREWAKITIQSSTYLKGEWEQGVTFYAQKGHPLSDGLHSFTEYKQQETTMYDLLFEKSVVEGQKIDFLGLASTDGVLFDPENDMVIGSMDLVPDFSSQDLTFESLYLIVTAPLAGYLYGEEGIREFLGLEAGAPIPESDMSQFRKAFYTVSGYTYQEGVTEIYIPERHRAEGDTEDYPVVMIDANVFEGLTNVTKVHLPSTLEMIDAHAFEGCSALTDINFPDSLTEIGDSAFKGCSALRDVTIPRNLLIFGYKVFEGTQYEMLLSLSASGQPYIMLNGGRVLYKCLRSFGAVGSTLSGENILILDDADIYSIAGGAFAETQGLVKAAIRSGVTLIGNGAFRDCPDLDAFLPGPQTQYLLDEVFMGCTKLKEFFTGSDNIVQIGARAFKDCTALVGRPYTPPTDGREESPTAIKHDYFYFGFSFTTLGEGAFENCTSLTYLEMARFSQLDGYTSIYQSTLINYIPRDAFKGCTNLVEIHIMDEVVEIASGAFENCTSLQTVYIGDTQRAYPPKVCKDAFKGCTNLHRIYVSRTAATEDDLVEFEDGCFDVAVNPYFFIRISTRDGVARYQANCPTYANYFTMSNPVAPSIHIRMERVPLQTTDSLLIDTAFVKQYVSAEDGTGDSFELTPQDELIWTVTSVVYNRESEDGTTAAEPLTADAESKYDLSEPGRYTVYFTVSDLYGMTSDGYIYLIVTQAQ